MWRTTLQLTWACPKVRLRPLHVGSGGVIAYVSRDVSASDVTSSETWTCSHCVIDGVSEDVTTL